MNEQIFGAYAQNYWNVGLPVIPLKIRDKRPFVDAWQRHAEQMPSPEEQSAWLERYGPNNIGLPLGPQSGVAVFDVDTNDEAILEIFSELLPESPWVRVGAKGYVIAVKFHPDIPTFRIKDISGKTLIEYLSKGTQVVLPPSIHPDTGKPYAANSNLWEVLDSLPEVNDQIESLLRGALKDADITLSHSGSSKIIEWVPQGARDVKMIEQAGLYAYAVTRGERTLLEALGMLQAWKSNFVEHVAGDDVDIDKGIQRLIQFICRDVLQGGKILPQGWDDGLTDEDKAELGLTFTEDDVEWSAEEIRNYLKKQFELHEPNSSARMTTVEYALSKIAKSRTMSSLEKEQLLRYIADVSRINVTVSALRNRVKELAQGPIEGLNHTEIARAVRDHIEQVTPLKFAGGEFRRWNGSHWDVMKKSEIFNIIADNYGTLALARRASDHKGIYDTLSHMCEAPLAEIEVKGINFANGVLLENGQLVDHSPQYGMTYTLAFRYMPQEAHRCERFVQFLHDCWGEDPDYEQKLMCLQEAICSTVFGFGPKYQRAILLLGPPRTGKSQLLDIIQSLVPDNARSAVPPDQWGDRFMPAQLFGKILNFCGELSEKKTIDGQKFKEVVDGSEISGQHKGMQIFTFKPKTMHWFGSNHAPRTTDTSAAFSRRWVIIRFDHPVDPTRAIPNLGEEIVMNEREAIMAWAVQALPRLREQRRYTLPPSHEAEINDMAKANNSVRYFLEESGKVQMGISGSTNGEKLMNPISESSLYLAYSFFCSVGGVAKPVMRNRFRAMMKELANEFGFHGTTFLEHGNRTQGYTGITLVDSRAA